MQSIQLRHICEIKSTHKLTLSPHAVLPAPFTLVNKAISNWEAWCVINGYLDQEADSDSSPKKEAILKNWWKSSLEKEGRISLNSVTTHLLRSNYDAGIDKTEIVLTISTQKYHRYWQIMGYKDYKLVSIASLLIMSKCLSYSIIE